MPWFYTKHRPETVTRNRFGPDEPGNGTCWWGRAFSVGEPDPGSIRFKPWSKRPRRRVWIPSALETAVEEMAGKVEHLAWVLTDLVTVDLSEVGLA